VRETSSGGDPSKEKLMSVRRIVARFNRSTMLIRAALLAVFLLLLSSPPSRAETKEGEAKLLELTGLDVEKKGLKIELGDTVKATCICSINPDQFKKRVVQVDAIAKNTADKPMYYGLYVAFFDKDKKLIACCVFGGEAIFSKLDAKGFSSTSKSIELPIALIDKIATYQVSLVTDEKIFGMK
jgi:hypothetical protein